MVGMSPEHRSLVEALAEVGVEASNIFGLVNSLKPYPKAIPVLLEFLPRVEDIAIKEGIVRALTVKEASGIAAKPLLLEFERLNSTMPSREASLKWAIGNALSVVATDEVFNDVERLVTDKKHGKAREMLAVALGRMKDRRAVDVLIKLLTDEMVAGHAIIALGKLRAKEARAAIVPFLDHPEPWVRKEARRTLDKIDKAR